MAANFRIGKWIVQPRRAIIQRGDETVHLSPRAMAVLVCLADAKGAVLSRNELLDTVWPRMAVTQDALSQCIVELRKAFRDDSKKPRVIETIPKVGLRLMAPVEAVRAPSTGARRVSRRVTASVALIVAGAVFGLASWFAYNASSPRSPTAGTADTDRRSVAVLRFSSQDGAGNRAAFFAESIYDELLSQLAKIDALNITVARSSAADGRSIREIGRDAHAASILTGRARASGDAVFLDVQLTETETGRLLWADTFPAEVSPERYFEIHREITVNIAQALHATLAPESLAALASASTTSRQAYELYLTGNDYFRRSNDRESMISYAAKSYARATEADPSFALAWARLAVVHTAMYWFGFDRTPARLRMASDAIRRAFELAPDLPDAHLANANYLYRGLGHYEDALVEFDVAEQAMPGDADLHMLRASLHRRLGHWEQAVNDGQKAVSIDPTNALYLSNLAKTYLIKRDYVNAERYFKWINELRPDDAATYLERVALALNRNGDTSLARQYEASQPVAGYDKARKHAYTRWLTAIYDGNYRDALDVLDRIDDDRVFDADLGRYLTSKDLLYARTYRLAGNRERSLHLFESVERSASQWLAAPPDEDPFTRACWYLTLAEAQVALGRTDEALESMRAALSLVPKATNAIEGAALQLAAVIRVLVPAGEANKALEELSDYLAHPGLWSAEALSRDPRLAPLRSDARFRALLRQTA